jgi:glycerol-3-phosphate acyltransferase PlsY
LKAAPVVRSTALVQALLLPLVAVVSAYALGGILGADLVGRWRGFEPRHGGSGNPGATNVYRTVGAWPALAVLFWDAGKGWLAAHLPFWMGCGHAPIVADICALAVLSGHAYPPWRRTAGGKGVATFLGVLLAFSPPATLAFLALWTVVFLAFRYVSLASLAAGALAVAVWGIDAPSGGVAAAWTTAALAYGLILWRHRTNIHRLCNGKEPRMGKLRADGR